MDAIMGLWFEQSVVIPDGMLNQMMALQQYLWTRNGGWQGRYESQGA